MASGSNARDVKAPPTWPHSLALLFLLNHLVFPWDTWMGDCTMRFMYDQGDPLVVELAGHAILVTIYTVAAQVSLKPSLRFAVYKATVVVPLCLLMRFTFGERVQENINLTILLRDMALTGFFNSILLQFSITPPMPRVRKTYPIIWNGVILSLFLFHRFVLPGLLSHLSIRSHYDLPLYQETILHNVVHSPYLIITEILLRIFPLSLARVAIVRGPRRRAIVTTTHAVEAEVASTSPKPSFVFRMRAISALPLLFFMPTFLQILQKGFYTVRHPLETVLYIYDRFGNATLQSGKLVRLLGWSLRVAVGGSPLIALGILRDELRKYGLAGFFKSIETFGYFCLTILVPYQAYFWARDGSAVLRWLRCFMFGE